MSAALVCPYLEGMRFTNQMGHGSLKWIGNLADAPDKLIRWRLCLSEMEFDVLSRIGIKHQAPEVMSRYLTTGGDCILIDDAVPVMSVSCLL